MNDYEDCRRLVGGVMVIAMYAIGIAFFVLLIGAAHAHERTDKECREAGDMIEHVAQARDSGSRTLAQTLADFRADIIAISQFPPEQRWFVEDEDDARVLLNGVERVWRAPKSPREQGDEFYEDCTH